MRISGPPHVPVVPPVSEVGPAKPRDDVRELAPGSSRVVAWTVPVEALCREIDVATQWVTAAEAAPLPDAPRELAQRYAGLGRGVAHAEAVLMAAVDALDPKTGGGVAQPSEGYRELRRRTFAALRRAGKQFARLETTYSRIVHQVAAWTSQRIEAAPDRGDGRPLYHYFNSYKRPGGLSREQRVAEHNRRVEAFESGGGRWDAIITAAPGVFDRLQHRVRYDYAMLADGTLRLHENYPDGAGPAKPGHSLLASGGPQFVDDPILLAGEIWVYRDAAGEVEAVVVANNSGHFKPDLEDLDNATPYLEALGVPAEKIIHFGGPNNIPTMMAEIGANCGLGDLSHQLPPDATEILKGLSDPIRRTDAVAVRTWKPVE